VNRVPLDDSDFPELHIEPRPVPLPEPEPQAEVVIPEPVPVRPAEPQQSSIKGVVEKDGPTRDQILLQAIVLEARKEQTPVTMAAMRSLIAKFSSECGLGF
jgi:hypothetical protein